MFLDTEEESVKAFGLHPLTHHVQTDQFSLVLLVYFQKEYAAFLCYKAVPADEAGLHCIQHKINILILIQAEQTIHYELYLTVQLIQQSVDRLERILDSLSQQMRKILVAVQEQVEGLLGRDLEMFGDGKS
jgi:hypothetical protein